MARRKSAPVVEQEAVVTEAEERQALAALDNRHGDVLGPRSIGNHETLNGRRGRAPKKDTSRPCECGCNRLSLTGRFAPGHDQALKGRLLAAHDAGDEEAGRRLVEEYRWFSWEQLAERGAKAEQSAEARAGRERAKIEARLAKARVAVAKLEGELASL